MDPRIVKKARRFLKNLRSAFRIDGSAGILPAPFGILPNGFSCFDLPGRDAGECGLEARAPA
ncbi:MAG: hypothetical protein NTV93_04635 [Verrucomicrobia bacterium]|nr:hypothetical protein [Verrucomicrobiota bacterium]